MIYQGIYIVLILLAIVVLLIALKILLRRGWIKGFLIGVFGLLFVSITCVVSLLSIKTLDYTAIEKNKSVAQLSFVKTGVKEYTVTINSPSLKQEKSFNLKGDTWSLNTKILRIPATKVEPAYTLGNISSHFYQFERSAEGNDYRINFKKSSFNLWEFLDENQWFSYPFEAREASVNYIPMADAALYKVYLSRTDLTVRPANDVAKAQLAE